MSNRIENSDVSSDLLEALETTLIETNGIITVSDAVTRIGIDIHQAREAICRLMELYEAEAFIAEDGAALIRFRLPLRRRQPLLMREWWQRRLAGVERGIRQVVRPLVVVVVVLYVGWIFLLVQIITAVLLILARSEQESVVSQSRTGRKQPAVRKGLRVSISDHLTRMGQLTPDSPETAPRVTGYDVRRDATRLPMKPWLRAIGDFVLGEELKRGDTDHSRELASFIRTESPVVTSSEIVLLSGCSFEEADKRLARYCVQFGGESMIDDEGVVIADFSQFAREAAAGVESPILYWWQENELPYATTGNHPVQDMGIIIILLTTIVFSMAVNFQWIPLFTGNELLRNLVGLLPGFISALLLVIATLRIPFTRLRERFRLHQLFLKNLLKKIADNPHGKIGSQEIEASIPIIGRVTLSPSEIERCINHACWLWEGEVQITNSGKHRFLFARLAREWKSVRRARFASRA